MTLRAAKANAPALAREAIGLGGAGLIVWGAWLIYAPAGLIVGGAMLCLFAYVSAKAAAR